MEVRGRLVGMFAPLFCATLLFVVSPRASAACADDKIWALADDGKTPAQIAKRCKMDVDYIEDLLAEDPPDPPSKPKKKAAAGAGAQQGLPSGTPLAPCGCYGPDSGALRPAPSCQSGYAQPRMCGFPCIAGGVAYQGVCS